jgi:hypothetical protein
MNKLPIEYRVYQAISQLQKDGYPFVTAKQVSAFLGCTAPTVGRGLDGLLTSERIEVSSDGLSWSDARYTTKWGNNRASYYRLYIVKCSECGVTS